MQVKLAIVTLSFSRAALGISFDFDRATRWANWTILIGFAIAAGVALCLVAAMVVAGLFEKQRVRICEPISSSDPIDEPDYLRIMTGDAIHAGFIDQGRYRHANRSGHKILFSILFSPDRRTVALICSGKTLGLRTRRSMLMSELEDETFLVTTDETGHADLSGVMSIALLLNASFWELWRLHQQRLAETSGEVRDLSAVSAVDAIERPLRMAAERDVELGNGKFVDRKDGIWRYTLAGTIGLIKENFGRQLRIASAQKERAKIPRPGHRKYLENAEMDAEIHDAFDDKDSTTRA